MTRRAPNFRRVDAHSGAVADRTRSGEVQTLAPKPPAPPCELVRHHPGRRVQFTRWHSNGYMETVTGMVLSHAGRTVTIRTDAGEEIWTSCGHVIEARGMSAAIVFGFIFALITLGWWLVNA